MTVQSVSKSESTSILLLKQLSVLHSKQNLDSIYFPEQSRLVQYTLYCDLSVLFFNVQVEFETQILHDDRYKQSMFK